MLLQTSICLSIFKITASNFQGMLLSDSTLLRQHELDFDGIIIRYLLSYPCPYVLVEKLKNYFQLQTLIWRNVHNVKHKE